MTAGSILNTRDGRAAKPHRDLYTQAFSKARINDLESLIREKLVLFLEHLQRAAARNATIDLNMGLMCLTGDVAMYYCYQMNLGLLDAPDFQAELILGSRATGYIIPLFWCKLGYRSSYRARFKSPMPTEPLPCR